MDVRYSRQFQKQYKKLPLKIQKQTKARIELWEEDPMNSLLNHHVLTGNLKGLHSINITADVRAIYDELDKQAVMYVMIGTHSQLYK